MSGELTAEEFYAPYLAKIDGVEEFKMVALMVRSARLEKCYSQAQLGAQIGRSQTWISSVENARAWVEPLMAVNLGLALNKNPKLFLYPKL